MDNLKLPASPFFDYNENGYGNALVVYDRDGGKQILPFQTGFTKLEKAALMIAQGFLAGDSNGDWKAPWLAEQSVVFAKAVLEEANK